jgi:hypothetical protein
MYHISASYCSMSGDGLPSVVAYIVETHSKPRPSSEGCPVKVGVAFIVAVRSSGGQQLLCWLCNVDKLSLMF